MKKRWIMFALIAVLLTGVAAVADEGMWLYNAPPKDKIKARYNFEPSQEWLDHVRLSSVRFGGASGSLVSPDGLVMTNHHVGASCVHRVSTADKDYMKLGFYAHTQAEEAKCPGMEVSVLQGIEDVTAKVNADVKPGMSPADVEKTQRATIAAMVKECGNGGLRCDVSGLYSGALYHLYKYKRFRDVRLVFAPEYDAAFFGGDPDNFEYPRYALDLTFLRLYENDKPIHADNFLKWSANGVKEDEVIFVSGHPGSTGRLNTMAQLEFMREVQYPTQLKALARRLARYKEFSATSPENARQVERDIFGMENSQKATKGYYAGLLDKKLMAMKAADEKKLRDAVLADPKLKDQFGDPWKEIAESLKVTREMFNVNTFVANAGGFGGRLPVLALSLIRAVNEQALPEAERTPEGRFAGNIEQRLFSTDPMPKSLDEKLLTDSLTEMRDSMPTSELLKKVLNGRTPEQAAKEIIQGTKLDDVAFRKELYQGGKSAIEKSTDPLVVVMRMVEPEARAVRKEYTEKSHQAEVRIAAEKVAKARFAVEGLKTPPDANSTLRLSYGAVKGYVEDGQGIVPKGTKVVPFTTFGQAFDYANQHSNKLPYQLPDSWMKAKSKLNLNTPLNFTSTADIIGGNSGSPVVNKNGEVVGLIFDGNINSLAGRFMFDETMNRAISVDSRGIVESLRNIYGASALADELIAPAAKAVPAAAAK